MSKTSTEWPVKLSTGDTRPDDWGVKYDGQYEYHRPCVGCGYCCISVPCYISQSNDWWQNGGCIKLVWSEKDNRYWCQAVLDGFLGAFEYDICPGAGCCSPLNTWRQDVKERRIK